jgi:hypothetical protein
VALALEETSSSREVNALLSQQAEGYHRANLPPPCRPHVDERGQRVNELSKCERCTKFFRAQLREGRENRVLNYMNGDWYRVHTPDGAVEVAKFFFYKPEPAVRTRVPTWERMDGECVPWSLPL